MSTAAQRLADISAELELLKAERRAILFYLKRYPLQSVLAAKWCFTVPPPKSDGAKDGACAS